jgi:hypothetical protein
MRSGRTGWRWRRRRISRAESVQAPRACCGGAGMDSVPDGLVQDLSVGEEAARPGGLADAAPGLPNALRGPRRTAGMVCRTDGFCPSHPRRVLHFRLLRTLLAIHFRHLDCPNRISPVIPSTGGVGGSCRELPGAGFSEFRPTFRTSQQETSAAPSEERRRWPREGFQVLGGALLFGCFVKGLRKCA